MLANEGRGSLGHRCCERTPLNSAPSINPTEIIVLHICSLAKQHISFVPSERVVRASSFNVAPQPTEQMGLYRRCTQATQTQRYRWARSLQRSYLRTMSRDELCPRLSAIVSLQLIWLDLPEVTSCSWHRSEAVGLTWLPRASKIHFGVHAGARTTRTATKDSFHWKVCNINLLTGLSLLSPAASSFRKLHYCGTVKRFNDLNSAPDLSQVLSLPTEYQTHRLLTQTQEILSEIF